MENYIVRIYRRYLQGKRQVAGMVEEVGKARMRPFANIEELWNIVAGKPPRPAGRRAGARQGRARKRGSAVRRNGHG